MGREPFSTPAERSAQAMAKMTPGTLHGASRISTPGRAPSRPKRTPLTAPLSTFVGVRTHHPAGATLGTSENYDSPTTWTMAGLRAAGTNPGNALISGAFVSGWGDGEGMVASFSTSDDPFDVTVAPNPGYYDIGTGDYHFVLANNDDADVEMWAFAAGADFTEPDEFDTVPWAQPNWYLYSTTFTDWEPTQWIGDTEIWSADADYDPVSITVQGTHIGGNPVRVYLVYSGGEGPDPVPGSLVLFRGGTVTQTVTGQLYDTSEYHFRYNTWNEGAGDPVFEDLRATMTVAGTHADVILTWNPPTP